jgi:hypothetical protein
MDYCALIRRADAYWESEIENDYEGEEALKVVNGAPDSDLYDELYRKERNLEIIWLQRDIACLKNVLKGRQQRRREEAAKPPETVSAPRPNTNGTGQAH